MMLPTLYKKTSTGALQEWTIGTEGNVIVTHWGQVGGAIQATRDEVKSGKNIGKKNETTAEQQAQLEAQAQWEKKLKKGYVKTAEDAEAGKVDDIIEGGVSPMLAHKFSEQAHKIKYPAYAQPKFDGHRCVVVVKDGEATMWTRTRKPITGLPHIINDVEQWAHKMGWDDVILDGELYNHEYKNRFEELSSFIRTPEPKEGYEVVQYHVYDLAGTELTQAERLVIVDTIEDGRPTSLVAVETVTVADEDELMLAFEKFLAQGYEGLMVRNADGVYVNKRSYDLQKVKEFDDAEFEVVGVEEGRGKLAGKAIFVCKYEDRTFNVKMKGKIEDLKQYIDDPSLALGRQLTVRFQGFTNKNKVPRFPVGVRFKEDL